MPYKGIKMLTLWQVKPLETCCLCRSVVKHKTLNYVHVDDQDTGSDQFSAALYFDHVEVRTDNKRDTQALVDIKVSTDRKALKLNCKLDTGAEGNIIPLATYKLLAPDSDFDRNGTP